MSLNRKICIVKDHQEYFISHACMFESCKFPTRWCCSECLNTGIHNHHQQDNKHFMSIIQMAQEIKSKQQVFKHNFDEYKTSQYDTLQKKSQMSYLIEKSMKNFSLEFYKVDQEINNLNEYFCRFLSILNENKFNWLNDEMLNRLCQSKEYQNRPDIRITQQFGIIDKNGQEKFIRFYQNQTGHSQQIVDVKNTKYIVQEIDEIDKLYNQLTYSGSSISKNEKYLAYGGSEKLLKIYDIRQKNYQKKRINLIRIFMFANSLKIHHYYMLDQRKVMYMDLIQRIISKKMYQQQIHLSNVYNILTIQNDIIITCSDDNNIIKTDMKSKKQIFKLTGHTGSITAIDYNDQDQIIVSGSYDKSIKLWSCKFQSIIINKEKADNEGINQIQLINNNSDVLSLHFDGVIYKWKIDLQNRDLMKVLLFSDQNKIFNFYQVNQDQNIILLCGSMLRFQISKGKPQTNLSIMVEVSLYIYNKQFFELYYIRFNASRLQIVGQSQIYLNKVIRQNPVGSALGLSMKLILLRIRQIVCF